MTHDPIGPLGLFDGFGVEIEYMIVDRDTMRVLPIADRLLVEAGVQRNEICRGPICRSNELVLHVVELKTNGPAPALAPVADAMMDEIGAIAARLQDDNACLLPGAMHPLMLPDRDMVLWPHDNQEIYATYDRIFDCRGHGWSNLQSVHLNLPFANDDEFGRLHAAIRVVLPLLPGLAASSPFREGATTGFLDTRLDVYRTNARRIPSITGHVVPEPATTRADYERTILEPMYRDIRPHDPENILQEEWLNSRGAIARFDRNAIEIRVLDVQENPHADVAVLSLIVGVLRALVAGNLSSFESQSNLGTEELAKVFHAVTREGDRAVVSYGPMLEALGLSPRPVSVAQVWRDLAEAHTPRYLQAAPGPSYDSRRRSPSTEDGAFCGLFGDRNPTTRPVAQDDRLLGHRKLPWLHPSGGIAWVLTCEHATAFVPTRWRSLFEDRRAVLTTHRALDLGALDLARYLSRSTKAPLIAATATRLLVDTNRPLGHPRLFSEFSRNLPPEERTLLVERWHRTHWDRVTESLERSLARHQRVIHLGIHSFTPVLHGIPRRADASLLYDPQRPLEQGVRTSFFSGPSPRGWPPICTSVATTLPGAGRRPDDVPTTAVRPRRYLGVELEINQSILTKKGAIAAIGPVVAEALRSAGARP